MNAQRKTSKKSTYMIIAVLIIAAVAYFFWSGSKPAPSSTITVNNSTDQVGARVLSLLRQISSLKIDSSFFNDPGYKTLQDYSVAIPPENVGRINPFAPLPGVPTHR